jgi:hypothetical protein
MLLEEFDHDLAKNQHGAPAAPTAKDAPDSPPV